MKLHAVEAASVELCSKRNGQNVNRAVMLLDSMLLDSTPFKTDPQTHPPRLDNPPPNRA
jgi:hypothetical protein